MEDNPGYFKRQVAEKAKEYLGSSDYKLRWRNNTIYLIYDGKWHRIGEVIESEMHPISTRDLRHPQQHLYANPKNRKEQFVLSRGGHLVQRRVWRVLAPEDVEPINNGQGMSSRMDPTDPDARSVQPPDHVAGGKRGRASPYISTTKIEHGHITNPDGDPFDASSRRVEIDLLVISPSQIVDVSNKAVQEKYQFFTDLDFPRIVNDANRTQEVLIKGKIPAEAIHPKGIYNHVKSEERE